MCLRASLHHMLLLLLECRSHTLPPSHTATIRLCLFLLSLALSHTYSLLPLSLPLSLRKQRSSGSQSWRAPRSSQGVAPAQRQDRPRRQTLSVCAHRRRCLRRRRQRRRMTRRRRRRRRRWPRMRRRRCLARARCRPRRRRRRRRGGGSRRESDDYMRVERERESDRGQEGRMCVACA